MSNAKEEEKVKYRKNGHICA